MTASPPRILCLGSSTLDTILKLDDLPRGPGKLLPSDMVRAAHGMAGSAAATVARLGGRAGLISRVGDDADADLIIGDFEAAGVDCSRVERIPGTRSTLSTVLVGRAGERVVLPYYDPGLWTPQPRFGAEIVDGQDAVLVDVRWPEGAARLLSAARDAGIPAVLDGDTGPRAVHERLLPLSTHAVFSDEGALGFTGETDPVRALERIAARHDGFVSVTVGPAGCLLWDRALRAVRHLPAPRVEAVDTLAAGDVFHGAFVLMLAEGCSIEESIRFANTAAAMKCRVFGGRKGTPTRDEVKAFRAAR